MQNIPIDLLRTFLKLIETKSFSQTADMIGRSQSTVSLQMKRLQDIAGLPLTTSSGKDLALTQTGLVMQTYAKKMLDLNDECVRLLEGRSLSGTIRIGIPSDFAIALLPTALGRFSTDFPDVALEVTCRASSDLVQLLEFGELDIVVALDTMHQSRFLKCLWSDPVVWVGHVDRQLHALRPLPIVLFPAPCLYRANLLRLLTQEKIPYRVAFASESMAANCSAIEAGLGLTTLSKNSIPPNMRVLSVTTGLPVLPHVTVGLFWNSRGATESARQLVGFLETILIAKLGSPQEK